MCVCVFMFMLNFLTIFGYLLQFIHSFYNSIPAVGVLTLFYGGMLDLSKILMFPLNDDSFYKDAAVNMDIGVLIRESYVCSSYWKDGIETLPFVKWE